METGQGGFWVNYFIAFNTPIVIAGSDCVIWKRVKVASGSNISITAANIFVSA